MLRIAVVEDEEEQLRQIAAQVRRVVEAHGLQAQIEAFSGAQPLLDGYAAGKRMDLILLDIQMPGMDGMAAASALRALDDQVLIVFVTSMAQYALQGYKVNAFDFLVKPLTQEAAEACLHRALRRLRRRAPASLRVRCGAEMRIVPVKQILFAEYSDHRTLLRTREEEIPCAGTISSIEEQLLPHGFFRCHSAFVVNLAMVERLEGADLFVGGYPVPLSKHRRKQFLSALAAYWGERG
ncbi:MAG: LytTR family DNA-binding domain-containing protein [Clostridiales bacterium]|nr:LytTR family DNA-binding domain-containing protein [Clostridiales bacterium]MDY5515842.1 LytTR family DNA-binding domain-containing protein [Candidatus Ventricola sp.]